MSPATSEAIHTGTICQHGTTCRADLTDRRLGDCFSIEVDADGALQVAVSDTRQCGAVALPLHIRQTAGGRGDDGGVVAASAPLPVTGGGLGLLRAGLALAAVARRRRRG